MSPIPLTPQVMFDLYLMCCVWEWENACVKAGRKDGDTVRPVLRETQFQRLMRLGPGAEKEEEKSPFSFHRTTVDKVLRLLKGLKLITELQVKSMQRDRDLQNLFYRRSKQRQSSDPSRHDLKEPKELLIFIHDLQKTVNKKKLTRDVFYYPTANGQATGRLIAEKYKDRITKESYIAEMERQDAEWAEMRRGAKAAMRRHYRARVEEETS